ncbi:amino acid ABC transporter permease [Mumia sp. zg.B53]|uniref:amino acid ABC transporter permease n=1 Tax=unclassified Mumia TaxID=2621872 RepID=UPI001C6E9BC4|nr:MULTISPECIES: amino acid ABC transporter permease [unclassified Mumia]MBW9204915.1 amino acid ABC transporter permease [Mumia sp. zg.B17]MBW9213692.1 amino acid ABC transporter permease [Mumia sp. zg.B53]
MSTPTKVATRRPLSPRKRAQRIRFVQYAVLIGLVLAAIFFADWKSIGDAFFKPDLIKEAITGGLWDALFHTVIYTVGAFAFGLVVGTILAIMRLSEVGPYRWLSTAYIEFFRGLPALIVFLIFSLLPLAFPALRIPFDPYGTVWLALGIVASAYMAETIRGGIQAVPKGQTEAARSLGMTSGQAMRKVVLPQAFRTMLPPLTNELILLVKDSSLVFIIGLTADQAELTKFGRDMSVTYANVTPLVVAGFAYLIITLPLSVIVRRLEASAGKAR